MTEHYAELEERAPPARRSTSEIIALVFTVTVALVIVVATVGVAGSAGHPRRPQEERCVTCVGRRCHRTAPAPGTNIAVTRAMRRAVDGRTPSGPGSTGCG
jgi:hypothetical protein